MNKIFLFFIFICLSTLSANPPKDTLQIESNVWLNLVRYIKLNDGSYWQVKLDPGFFSWDKSTAANWWRWDRVVIRKGVDSDFPYLMENLENKEIVACTQFDPLLFSSRYRVVVLNTDFQLPSQSNEKLTINSILPSSYYLFVQLSDSSYWEIMPEKIGWFKISLVSLANWNRFDKVSMKKSDYAEYPYILINLVNGEEVLCRQVDPAIPYSVHERPNLPVLKR